jgi:hypothetical protein
MVASVEEHVRGMFAEKSDVDDDILTYVITCLEDETFEFGKDGQEIFDTVGIMLVRRLHNLGRCSCLEQRLLSSDCKGARVRVSATRYALICGTRPCPVDLADEELL